MEKREGETGNTCDCPGNSYVNKDQLKQYPNGKRIDYIFYRPNKGIARVNFLTFEHFSPPVLIWHLGYQSWHSQNACENIKQKRPWSDCFSRSSLIWVCPVCLGFLFQAAGIRKMLVRISIREDPGDDRLLFQKQSDLVLPCLSRLFIAGNWCSKF